ncbi:nucleoside-diphosphate sugar epimerase/dehydratase [Nocardioides conyzicola]|uniref:Nucleoside-diphosphate sugar epimerase/dehydratase n=1 Tax=Nocardioides conyzicola TaxID=1651781 RepID=A0ABP8XIF6_9ACTN
MIELATRVRLHRRVWIVSFDVLAWVCAFVSAALLRLLGVSQVPWLAVVLCGLASGVVFVLLGRLFRLHQGRARMASLDEMILLGLVALPTGVLVFLVNLAGHWIPRSVPLGATIAFVVIAAWGRATWKRLIERGFEVHAPDGSRVLIVGAGEGGYDLIRSMLHDPERHWQPVGFLDDDPQKRHRRIRGVPVLGTTKQLAEVVQKMDADTVVIAIPSAHAAFIRDVSERAAAAGVDVKVLPPTAGLLSEVGIRDIRDINLTDVLGRHQLDTDLASIAHYLEGRRVLVTGAGGSIGSVLVQQIHAFNPARLYLLDRDESALHAVQLALSGRALLDSDDVILCDIRDEAAVLDVFRSTRPDVVFHAAALKHLPMLQRYPAEAVKTNIRGTANVLEAARAVGVERFVNISTDKAADPSSVLGYSKRIAEMLTAGYADGPGVFLSVRFGNVLGSRGSVLTSFAKQIHEGGPVTVTHPDVTRYFMTIEEACQLVVQAAAIGSAGEALVLDMGEPVRILDVANQLIRQDGGKAKIEFTGLRPGEKMHEDLFGEGEPRDVRPEHPMVSHVPVPAVSRRSTDEIAVSGPPESIVDELLAFCQRVPGADRHVSATSRPSP